MKMPDTDDKDAWLRYMTFLYEDQKAITSNCMLDMYSAYAQCDKLEGRIRELEEAAAAVRVVYLRHVYDPSDPYGSKRKKGYDLPFVFYNN